VTGRFFPAASIRGKLTLSALVPLVITLFLVTLAAFSLINAWIVGEAQKRVRNDLNAAREVFGNQGVQVRDVVHFTAHSSVLLEALQGEDGERLRGELEEIARREGLDILTLAGTDGTVLVRGANPQDRGGDRPTLPGVAAALRGEDFTGVALLDDEQLRREGEGLAERAAIELRPPGGGHRPAVERRGMFLVAAAPVHDRRGTLVGCIYGGVLLNGNLALVDRIRDLVYGDETFEGTEVGSATIFLEDVRVATTVRLRDGGRALGTLLSPEVAAAVLERRETWLDRARVVDRWYLTAYEPLIDGNGRAIGALYVGLLEKPFNVLKARASLILLGLLLLGSGVGFLLARTLARRLSRPILELAASAEQVAAGRWDVPLPAAGGDEIGHLSAAFDRMTSALQVRDRELQSLNQELERKVEERTALLEEKSLQLIHVQEELARAERLAAIGSLAAGVAHEINNPAAIIRGNVEILLMDLPAQAEGREEAEEILRQTERISLITQNMLAFARKQSLHRGTVRLNDLLEEILAQAGHLAPLGAVQIERRLDPQLPPIEGDGERLRQVFTNIIVNALQAMAGSGALTVASRADGTQVEVAVGDTGPGVPRELREKIFDPFFTTRGSGTGLGLSVSYGIVQAHNGSIAVESEAGHGSTFRVRLPAGRPSV